MSPLLRLCLAKQGIGVMDYCLTMKCATSTETQKREALLHRQEVRQADLLLGHMHKENRAFCIQNAHVYTVEPYAVYCRHRKTMKHIQSDFIYTTNCPPVISDSDCPDMLQVVYKLSFTYRAVYFCIVLISSREYALLTLDLVCFSV